MIGQWYDIRVTAISLAGENFTLETSVEDVVTTLETSGEDVVTTLETSVVF